MSSHALMRRGYENGNIEIHICARNDLNRAHSDCSMILLYFLCLRLGIGLKMLARGNTGIMSG